jgi:putative peptide zinc metalloprotease protein
MAMTDYSWNRIASVKPRLSSQVRIERVFYRSEPWYLLYDEVSGRSHRFPPAVYRMICMMDGEHDMQRIWELLQEGKDAPSQDEVLRTYNQLRAAELLHGQGAVDPAFLEEQRKHWTKLRFKQRFGSPLALRFNLWDPDRFISILLPLVRPLFSGWGFILWLVLIIWGVILTARHWSELTHNIADTVLAPNNLVIMIVIYPLIKFLHELGHAFAIRRWGGEVHEMGVMFLVFMPVPYVEASSSTAFHQRRARMAVSGAGIMVELSLAALAMILWSMIELGVVRSMAFNVIVIAGVSTLLFNGNPLLRFDGYYLFSDALELPNLAPRSTRYIGYLLQRHAFGMEHASSPAHSRGEAVWLFLYGVAAFCYRTFISVMIILFVAGKFFFIGVIIALWAVYAMLLTPIFKGLRFVFMNPALKQQRRRAITVLMISLTLVLSVLFQWSMPVWSNAQGVVWLPEKAQIRAAGSGFCREVYVQPGDFVESGQAIVRLEDDELQAAYDVLRAQWRELNARYRALWREDRNGAQMVRKKIDAVEAELKRHEERLENLTVRAGQAGLIHLPDHDSLLGRFLMQGELIAYSMEAPLTQVRASVSQADISLMRRGIEYVEIRLAERLDRIYHAEVVREVPAASRTLPSPALGKPNGGPIAIDPMDPDGLRAYESVFHFDLRLPDEAPVSGIGGRVHIRFHHHPEPLAWQWYRSLRQLFLRRFAV